MTSATGNQRGQWKGLSRAILFPLILILALSSCEDRSSQPESTPTRSSTLTLLHPPEAYEFFQAVVAKFNSLNRATTSGAIIRLSSSSFDDLDGVGRIGTPQAPASLWIAPSSTQAAVAKSLNAASFTSSDCASVMSTRLGVAYRSIDKFAISSSDGSIAPSELFAPTPKPPAPPLSFIMGLPRYTSSGNAFLTLAAGYSIGTPLAGLTREKVEGAVTLLRNSQSRTRSYYLSVASALSWLDGREGGSPVAVGTTEQSFTAYQRSLGGGSKLLWLPISTTAPLLDFPLCSIDASDGDAELREAQRIARGFFVGDDFKALLAEHGFDVPPPTSDPLPESVASGVTALQERWGVIRPPSLTLFIVDASIKTDRAAIETIRRELRNFIEAKSSDNDKVGIIAASTKIEVVSELGKSKESLQLAVNKLTTSGSNTIRDGILLGLRLLGGLDNEGYRRSVVVLTSGDQTTRHHDQELENVAAQLIGMKNVQLYVLGFANAESELDDLARLTRQLGGHFILTNTAAAPASFFPISREIQ